MKENEKMFSLVVSQKLYDELRLYAFLKEEKLSQSVRRIVSDFISENLPKMLKDFDTFNNNESDVISIENLNEDFPDRYPKAPRG